jgi:hypothetical protein
MFVGLHKSFYVKDPCKKCIVRPCCRNECEKLIDFRLCFYPFTNRLSAILITLSLYFSTGAWIISMIKMLSNIKS